jgi:GR25 family glycosyltransferase involved in LPS biosynthesis
MSWSVLVINLNSREDRWIHSTKQLEKLGWRARRIEAIDNPADTNFFTNRAVAACWLSHRKALNEFLQTEDTHALILEDDFDVRDSLVENDFLEFSRTDLDFIQIGFLYTTIFERIHIKVENIFDLVIRIFGYFEKILRKKQVSTKLLVQERKELPYDLVFADIRGGAHCYFLNRKAASYFVSLNEPIFLSTDDLYMAAGRMRYLRMARFRKSRVGQTNSISSINPR